MSAVRTPERAVAKKKTPGQRKQDEQSSARIAKDLLRKIGIICKAKGQSVTDYIDETLRPSVLADYQTFLRAETESDTDDA